MMANCAMCGNSFFKEAPHQRFCGGNCRKRWSRREAPMKKIRADLGERKAKELAAAAEVSEEDIVQRYIEDLDCGDLFNLSWHQLRRERNSLKASGAATIGALDNHIAMVVRHRDGLSDHLKDMRKLQRDIAKANSSA
jgi:hypothetical protein